MTNYNYYYGTDYTYDPVTKIFQLTGEIEQLRYNSSTKDRILGKYTCCSTSATATCSTLYYIDKIVSNTTARATGITSIPYYHIGNRNYNTSSAAMAQFGYMYNKNYETGSKTIANTESVLAMRNSYYATNSYFADDFTWDGSTYSLNNPFQYTSDMDMSSIVGKYTFFNTTATTTAATIYYVMSYNSQNNTYSVVLNNGEELNTIPTTYSYGSSYVDNQDGTYTIDNPTTFNPTEYSNHQSGLTGKYICKNASNGTCSDLHYILGVDDYHYAYLEVNKPIKFGKGVVYENGQYTLTDTQTSWNYLSNGLGLSNLHYTCWDETGVCSEVNYIYYIKTRTSTFYEFYIYYLKLDDGSDMEQAIHNMFRADDVNTYSSEAKQAVDEWYERYMLSYSNYLEDAIYCNNRNISRIISFNPNGGATRDTENLYFEKGFYCSDEHDQFSVSNPKARLTYPVGLLAEGEITSTYLRKAGADYWTMTPNAYIESILMINTVTSSGAINGQGPGNNRTIRPVISLKPGIE